MEQYLTNLTDKQWQVIEKIINLQERKRKHSLRNIMKAILYILKTGCQWRIIPNELPKEMQINKAAFTLDLKLTVESCIMQAK